MSEGDESRQDSPAGPLDFVVGFGRVFRPWFFGLLFVLAVVVVLNIGANRPDDPTFVGASDAAETTSTTGLAFEERRIAVGARCLRVEVASSQEQRAQGLKHRESLGEFHGMLFEFEQPVQAAFTMSEVKIPLTIGFYDEAGVPVDSKDMEPCSGDAGDCPTYSAAGPFKTALEVGRGQLPEGPLLGACPG
ncbi:MAG TPA: DUF192 domain-containing protein [Acidimicrobiia bacterium]|nr:DUF192 domain-containing protein [Acidimicrobiia bacterium]